MKSYADRTVDRQYQDALRFIIRHGYKKETTIQGVAQIVCLDLPPMTFDLSNGVPLITERKVSFWRGAIGEICAFVNGVHTQAGLEEFGCPWWKDWVTAKKCADFGLPEGDLGPASYGPAFHDFPDGNGGGFNQFEALVRQIKEKPYLATHEISPWFPPWILGERKVVVAPCHGWLHFEVQGHHLHMIMSQRSADFPIGVPANMIQYAALLMMMARATGLRPGKFVHQFRNAQIYENQLSAVTEMISREPRRLPTLTLAPDLDDLFAFRSGHFTLSDYNPHPALKGIPVAI